MFGPQRIDPLELLSADNAISPQVSRWEGVKASFDLASMSTIRGYLHSGRPSSKSEEMVDPDYLNDLYPQMEKPFDRPVAKEYAQFMIERDMERKRLMSIMEQSPEGIIQGVAELGGGLAASLLDPYEALGGFVVGAGIRLAVAGARAGRITSLLASAPETLTGRQLLGQSALYNTIGAAAIEPALFAGAQSFQEERTLADATMSIAGSAIMGSVIDLSVRSASRVIKDLSSNEFGQKAKIKKGLASQGKDIDMDIDPPRVDSSDVTLISRAGGQELRASDVPPGMVRKGNKVEAIGDFYILTSSPGDPSIAGRSSSVLTKDSPFLEASYAWVTPDTPLNSPGLGSSKYGLEAVDLSSARLIDADATFLNQDLETQKVLQEIGLTGNQSLTDFIEAQGFDVKGAEAFEAKVTNAFDRAGIDGFVSSVMDGDTPRDAITLFNQNAARSKGAYDIPRQPSMRGEMTSRADQVAKSLDSPESNYFYDKDTQEVSDSLPVTPREADEALDITEFDQTQLQQLASRENLNSSVKELVELSQNAARESEAVQLAIKRAINCRIN